MTAAWCATAAVLVVFGAGCGGGGDPSSAAAPPPALPHTGYADRASLERQLGNGFRQGLYRLAVMSQPGEGAADLGQALPTGTLRGVACADPPTGTGPAATVRCTARWRTVDDRPRATPYRVTVDDRGCFFATAAPPLDDVYDSTVRTYSVNPLAPVASSVPGC